MKNQIQLDIAIAIMIMSVLNLAVALLATITFHVPFDTSQSVDPHKGCAIAETGA